MSKKMAFSLMSLIIILALAFVVSSAMAADPFDVTFEGRESITYTPVSSGNITSISAMVTIKTGQSVAALDYINSDADGDGDADERNLIVTAFDKNGLVVSTTPANIHSSNDENNTPGSSGLTSGVMIRESTEADYIATGTQREYRVTIAPGVTDTDTIVSKVVITVKQLTTNDLAAVDSKGALVKTKLSSYTRVITVSAAPAANPDRPNVVSIQRLREGSQTVVSAFQEEKVTGEFNIRIVFTEKPHDFKLTHINVEGGKATNLVVGVPFAWHGGTTTSAITDSDNNTIVEANGNNPWQVLRPHPIEGMYAHTGNASKSVNGATIPTYVALTGVPEGADDIVVPFPTGDDKMYHQYRVTITPHRRVNTVKISIKEFHDNASPFPNVYKPFDVANKPNGREQLRLDVAEDLAAKGAGHWFYLPHSEGAKITYAGSAGHYILVKEKKGSGIRHFHEKDEENIAHEQTPAQLLYNVRNSGDLPNLETFLANNGTIDLVAYDGTAAGAAYISEIMWGTDASYDDATKSQWIEIANATSAAIGIGENKWALWFYQANETPRASYVKDDGTAGVLIDRVGTKENSTGVGWSIADKGQSGRTGIGEGTDVAAAPPLQKLISMYRLMDATTGTPKDGTMAGSWMASAPPSVNFRLGLEGQYDATPGASKVTLATPAPEPTPAPVVPVAAASDIKITEIMVDTSNGRLPQWIELTNVSGAEVSLAGWSVQISNSPADADAIGSSVSINLSGTLGVGGGTNAGGTMGKSLLLVSRDARSSSNLSGSARVVDVSSQTGGKGNYKLISDMAFLVALIPPQKTGVLVRGDTAGNLGAAVAWDIETDETGRSSLIRREMDAAGMATMGTAANGWVLASSTSLVSGPATWYGSDEDAGTPGYDAGGPLPVELSHFRPARDKATGQVVITWSTQSEAEQRWILHQAFTATQRTVPGHQCYDGPWRRHNIRRSSSIPTRIQLLNLTSYTTTRLKTYPSTEIVRRSPTASASKGISVPPERQPPSGVN